MELKKNMEINNLQLELESTKNNFKIKVEEITKMLELLKLLKKEKEEYKIKVKKK